MLFYNSFGNKIKSARPVLHYMLTYQQSKTLSKKSFIDKIRRVSQVEIEAYKVVIELHKDGNPHIHCVLKFMSAVSPAQLRNTLILAFGDDQIDKIHWSKVSSIKKANSYISKEDKEPYESASYNVSEKRTRTVDNEVGKELMRKKARNKQIEYLTKIYFEILDFPTLHNLEIEEITNLDTFLKYKMKQYDENH